MKKFSKYVGLDVHKETIAVSVAEASSGEMRYFCEIAKTLEALSKLVGQLKKGGARRSAVEDGGVEALMEANRKKPNLRNRVVSSASCMAAVSVISNISVDALIPYLAMTTRMSLTISGERIWICDKLMAILNVPRPASFQARNCLQERLRGERYARHWYDLAALEKTTYFEATLAARDVRQMVADHKTFFSRKRTALASQLIITPRLPGI